MFDENGSIEQEDHPITCRRPLSKHSHPEIRDQLVR
jgi:hypothetical protein